MSKTKYDIHKIGADVMADPNKLADLLGLAISQLPGKKLIIGRDSLKGTDRNNLVIAQVPDGDTAVESPMFCLSLGVPVGDQDFLLKTVPCDGDCDKGDFMVIRRMNGDLDVTHGPHQVPLDSTLVMVLELEDSMTSADWVRARKGDKVTTADPLLSLLSKILGSP